MSLSPVRQVNPNAAGTEMGGKGTGLPHVKRGTQPSNLKYWSKSCLFLKAIEKQQLQLNFEQVFEKYF